MEETPGHVVRTTNLRNRRVQLIYNPSAGAVKASPTEMIDVIRELNAWKLVPETFLIEAGSDLPGTVRNAYARGIRMFVVCGGDGTISAVACILAGIPDSGATLGIIPTGTQNNMALSLGIPTDIPAAAAILRTGQRTKVDIGMATYQSSSAGGGEVTTPFVEACSVGLVSTLYPSADDVQHGNLSRVGDFLTSLVSTPPAEIHLVLDDENEVNDSGYVLLVTNMPYIGLHYQVGAAAAFRDGLLDVLFFANLSKLELLGFIFRGEGKDITEDPRIQHYQARRVEIDTTPAMPIMADGNALGEGRVRIEVRRRALAVMVAKPLPEARSGPEQKS